MLANSNVTSGSSSGSGGFVALLTQPRYQRPLLIGSSLMLFQQITGQPSVLYYATQIFEKAGFASGQVGSCGLGCGVGWGVWV